MRNIFFDNYVSSSGDRPVPCGSADVGDYGSRGWASSRANWSHAAVAEVEAEPELRQKTAEHPSSAIVTQLFVVHEIVFQIGNS